MSKSHILRSVSNNRLNSLIPQCIRQTSHNAPFVTKICTLVQISVTKWCIEGYGTGELWVMGLVHCGIHATYLLKSFGEIARLYVKTKIVNASPVITRSNITRYRFCGHICIIISDEKKTCNGIIVLITKIYMYFKSHCGYKTKIKICGMQFYSAENGM